MPIEFYQFLENSGQRDRLPESCVVPG